MADEYQIGRGISPDTCPAILYHVMHFSQWERKKVIVWVIINTYFILIEANSGIEIE